jgi:cobalt-zinc-cadmium efflux system outer membrane protein
MRVSSQTIASILLAIALSIESAMPLCAQPQSTPGADNSPAQLTALAPFNEAQPSRSLAQQSAAPPVAAAQPRIPDDTLPPQEKTLSLSEVEALAVSFHPAIRVAEAEVVAARGRYVQVGLYPNPTIGYMADEVGNEGTAGMQGGYVMQEFVTAGKLRLSRSVAGRELAAAEQQLTRARLAVEADARRGYFEVLVAERALSLARQLQEMTARMVRTSELRLEATVGTGAALLQSQIENESVILVEQTAVNRYDGARRRLAALLGMEASALPSLEDNLAVPLPPLDWESTRARVLRENPELAAAQFNVEAARWAVDRAVAQRVPNVTLQTAVQYHDGTNDTVTGVQLGVPIPIFDRNQGGIIEAQGQLAAAEAALGRLQLDLEVRLAAVLSDYLSARARVAKFSETILPATQQSVDMIARAYEAGEIDYLQLLTAQQTYTNKHLAYYEELQTAWLKWADIESLLSGAVAGGPN